VTSTATRLYGVIGWPVAHSRSPAMHNAALAALGLDAVYLAFAVAPERLAAALAGARALGVAGLNVTIPHKEAALALVAPDELAARVGAVNTLTFDEDTVHGTNTDVHGFLQLCAEAGAPASPRAIVLGAGGAARAVVAALEGRARALTVVGRRSGTLTVGGIGHAVAPWSELPARLPGCDLLIDATPRGLDDAAPAVDLEPLPPEAVVLDLVVRRETAITRAAKARGLRAQAGAAMLLHQGAAALERWTGRPAPVEVMRRALDAALT
jgi:shikimate dehydrogenase